MPETFTTPHGPQHRDQRPDLTPTPPLKGSGPAVLRIDRADSIASLIMLLAMTMSSAAVLWSTQGTPYRRPMGFVGMAGAAWLLFIVGLFAIWEVRVRKGLSGNLFALGAALLALSGFIYLEQVSLVRLLLGDWVPAVMALVAAFTAGRAQRSLRASDAVPP